MAPTSDAQAPSEVRTDSRLQFLEGIRGITALYVVIFHVVLGFVTKPDDWLGKVIFRALAFGHEAVAIFITLSGFCLTLAVMKTQRLLPDSEWTLDLRRFAVRRARRILPPYYAALAFSLLLSALAPPLRLGQTGTIWDHSQPIFSAASISSHVLLVHNFFSKLKMTINGPLWSVATEWQIYILFALVLFPVRRRFGILGVLGVAVALGFAPLWWVPEVSRSVVSWYAVLFVLGMLTCLGSLGGPNTERRIFLALPLPVLSLITTLGVAVFGLGFAGTWFQFQPLADVLVGLSTALVLGSLISAPPNSWVDGVRRLLESPPLVKLGRMSYSLYLTHLPIVALVMLPLRSVMVGPWLLLISILLAVSASLAFGALFFRWIERPFLNQPKLAGAPPQADHAPTGQES
jgi:peptidoglycan/LPS O-acetylase OafA/YrhL